MNSLNITVTLPETPKKTNSSEDSARQGIGSLEIGLRVLNEIARYPQPVTLKELGQRLEMSPSRLHKYLVSLSRMGYIVQVQNARYTLGDGSLTLGMAALQRIEPVPITFKAAAGLHADTDRTVSVAIWNGHAPLIVHWLDSSRVLAVNVRLGTELSPFFSAAGRLFLAYLPDQRREEIVERFYQSPSALPRYQGKQLSKAEFYQLLDQIREEHLSCFYGDFLPDINVVSAPVFNLSGQVQAVISLMGMASDTNVTPGQPLEQKITATAREATRLICGRV